MENLRILFLCPQPLWPTNTGARLRNFHLANALAANCKITVLQITSPGEAAAPQLPGAFQEILSAVRGNGYTPQNILRGLTGPTPVTVLNYTSDNVAKVLSATLNADRFDAVQLESIHLYRYLEAIRQIKDPPVVVLDWHNIESELMRRYAETTSNPAKKLIATRTASLLHKLEGQALETFTAHIVVSEREREKLLARARKAQIHVIPNGVDAAAFASPSAKPGSHTLLFVGSMDYHANSDAVIWFCREIWPQLAAEFPILNFKIVGRNPPTAVRTLASSRVTVTGTVDDVRPFYHQSFAVIVPLRVGGGTRLKILEAMAAGVPVISTRLGAEGLSVEDHREILLADTAADIAAAIRALLSQPDLARRLSDAARTLVRTQYDWTILGSKLAALYESLTR